MDPQLAVILQLLSKQQNPAASSISGLATNTGVDALNNSQNPSLGFPSGGSLAPNASTAPQAPTPTFSQAAPQAPRPTTQPVTGPSMGMLSNPVPGQDSGMLSQSPFGSPLGQAVPNFLSQNLFGVGGSSISPSQAFQFATQ